MQAKQRQWRAREIVTPLLEKEKPRLVQEAVDEMRSEMLVGDKEKMTMELRKRVTPLVCLTLSCCLHVRLLSRLDQSSPCRTPQAVRMLTPVYYGHSTFDAAPCLRGFVSYNHASVPFPDRPGL